MAEQNHTSVSDLWRCKFCDLLTDQPRSHANTTCIVRARNAHHEWAAIGSVPILGYGEPGLDAKGNFTHKLYPGGAYVCFNCSLFTFSPSEFIKTSCCAYHCSATSAAQTHSHNTEHEVYALTPICIPKPEPLAN